MEVAMILFLGTYGLLMLGVEVPLDAVQTMLRQDFFFVYTRPGRAGYVINVALLAGRATRRACRTHARQPRAARTDRAPRHSARRTRASAQVGYAIERAMQSLALPTLTPSIGDALLTVHLAGATALPSPADIAATQRHVFCVARARCRRARAAHTHRLARPHRA